MPAMPSADARAVPSTNTTKGPELNISSKDVEGLVMEIKENLRLSATSMKAMPCSHISRKSSRASPYRVPCDSICMKKGRRKHQEMSVPEDPYELLQKLLRDGSLVNEAVRRLQLGLSPKQRYFYESDEDSRSPSFRF